MEYLRYCSSLLHSPPYCLGNNSWWGGYFLRVIWRKWGLCLRPIIQQGMYCQQKSPTLSPYTGPMAVTASKRVSAWFGIFRYEKYVKPTFFFSLVSSFSGFQSDWWFWRHRRLLHFQMEILPWRVNESWDVQLKKVRYRIDNICNIQQTRQTINTWLLSHVTYWLPQPSQDA